MKKALVVVIGLAAALATVTAQDRKKPSVEALIQEGLAAYKAGQHQAAIQKLQRAIGLIQQSAEKGLASFLPEPAEGWKADPPTSQSGNWGSGESAIQWTQAERRYTRESDGLEVTVTISDSPQIIQGQLQALKLYENPQMVRMMNQDPNRKLELIDADGWKGWKVTEKGESAQTMAIHESVMVMIEVRGDHPEVRDAFWSGLDRKGLAAAVPPAK